MNILSFNKITKPIYEGGIDIDCRPRAKWLVEVRRPDGTIRRPFGDNWIKNLFTNGFANNLIGSNMGWEQGDGWASMTFTYLFYKRVPDNASYNPSSYIIVGSGSNAPSVTDTDLQTYVKSATGFFASGNSVTQNSTTGDIVYTIKATFDAETGSATYREAGYRFNSALIPIWNLAAYSSLLLNRVVFPSNVNLSSGEQLILTMAVTIPTLAVTGKTITIAAQNGMNVSGELRCIGTTEAMAGGTVTAGGSLTIQQNYPLLFSTGPGYQSLTPAAGLTTATTFPAFNTNSSGLDANSVNATWAAYTTDSRYRDAIFTWGSGTPASNTDFRSMTFRSSSGNTINGYQLLLDNQMTKDTAATLAIGIRFSL